MSIFNWSFFNAAFQHENVPHPWRHHQIGVWSTSRLDHDFPPGKRPPVPRPGINSEVRRKIICPCEVSTPVVLWSDSVYWLRYSRSLVVLLVHPLFHLCVELRIAKELYFTMICVGVISVLKRTVNSHVNVCPWKGLLVQNGVLCVQRNLILLTSGGTEVSMCLLWHVE